MSDTKLTNAVDRGEWLQCLQVAGGLWCALADKGTIVVGKNVSDLQQPPNDVHEGVLGMAAIADGLYAEFRKRCEQ